MQQRYAYRWQKGYSMTVEFIIPGKPQGKERPRLSKSHTYTPAKTKAYEETVGWIYKAHNFPELKGAIGAEITIYYAIPKGTNKTDKEAMLDQKIRPTVRPDIDNILKAIFDSLNGIAYKDDNQIVSVIARKYYSDNPRVDVFLCN